MKRHAPIMIVALLTFACGRQDHEEHEQPTTSTHATTATTTSTATATTAAATPGANASSPYDLQFLDTMSHHHEMAVDMVKAGQGRFARKELEEAGTKIVADQQREIAQMKAWREQWYPGAAPAVNMNMPGMAEGMNMDMSHMTHLSGEQLDAMFIDMMIPHHQGAVTMARDALTRAEHPEIKEMARAIINAQTREIEQFRTWRR